MLFFSIYNERQIYRGKAVSEQWRHLALGRLELTLVVNTSFWFNIMLPQSRLLEKNKSNQLESDRLLELSSEVRLAFAICTPGDNNDSLISHFPGQPG